MLRVKKVKVVDFTFNKTKPFRVSIFFFKFILLEIDQTESIFNFVQNCIDKFPFFFNINKLENKRCQ